MSGDDAYLGVMPKVVLSTIPGSVPSLYHYHQDERGQEQPWPRGGGFQALLYRQDEEKSWRPRDAVVP
jgi:hypothetical protein